MRLTNAVPVPAIGEGGDNEQLQTCSRAGPANGAWFAGWIMVKSTLFGLQYLSERFAGVITAAACAALVIAALHIVADVFMTRFFRAPIDGTHQIVTAYYMVSLFFLPLAYAESRGAHIKADLFFSPLPFAVRWAVTFVTYVTLTGFVAVLTWQMYLRAVRQTRVGEMTLIGDMFLVLWPSRWLAVLGMAAFTVIALIRTLTLLLPGGYDQLERKSDDAE